MAVESPDVEDFDRPDLNLSPEMHLAQAEMAAERGEEYDPYEFEKTLEDIPDPHPIEDTEPVEGDENRHEKWLDSGE